MPVGSMPYLMRRGWPVCRLRSSFWCSSASGTICSTPRRIRANCSATVFTAIPFGRIEDKAGRKEQLGGLGGSVVHLELAHRFKGLTVVDDARFALTGRPGQ